MLTWGKMSDVPVPEGSYRIGVWKGVIVLDFGKKQRQIGLPPEGAERLANHLLEYVRQIREKTPKH